MLSMERGMYLRKELPTATQCSTGDTISLGVDLFECVSSLSGDHDVRVVEQDIQNGRRLSVARPTE